MGNMVTFGAEYILRTNESTISNEDIEQLIKIGKEKTEQNKSNITKAFDHNINDFRMDINEEHNYRTYEGTDYSNIRKKEQRALIINHGPRQRNLNVNYKEDAYYKSLLQKNKKKEMSPSSNKKIAKTFKVSTHSKYKYDFQFVSD